MNDIQKVSTAITAVHGESPPPALRMMILRALYIEVRTVKDFAGSYEGLC